MSSTFIMSPVSTPSGSQLPVNVKQERHDEAEINELAVKMMEQHKASAAKQAQAQPPQRLLNHTNQAGGQVNILNYMTRKPAVTGAASNDSSKEGSPDGEKKACDEESVKGRFGWTNFSKVNIPYIYRQTEKYCAVRMVELKLLNKYLNYLHQDIYNCTCVRSYYITEAESRLLNDINHKHCDGQFGRDMYTLKDLVVRLSDANKFYTFLDICYKKLLNGNGGPSDKCGFIRINKESVVPYTVRENLKFVPLFYFEGETENLKLKADYLSGWDLSYLKFCCKVQGIRNELFASDSVAVISLTDIKSYFPSGTEFEDYWPNKVVDSQLFTANKTNGANVHWTRQPTAPPPKVLNTVPPKPPVIARKAPPISYPAQQLQRILESNPQLAAQVQNSAWANGQASLAAATGIFPQAQTTDQVLRMAAAQAQQQQHQQQQLQHAQLAQAQRSYSAANPRSQNTINQRQIPAPANYNNYSLQLGINAAQPPPPLVRSAAAQLSSCVNAPTTQRSNSQFKSNPSLPNFPSSLQVTKINNNNPTTHNKNIPSMPVTLLSYPNHHQQKSASSPVPNASPARASPKSLQAKHPPGLISMNNMDLFNSLHYYQNQNPSQQQSYHNNNNLSRTTNSYPPKINNLNNARLKSVITSTTSDVIDLSSSPRSAVAAYQQQQHSAQHSVQHQQQQQQQQLHQHQMQQRNALSNGRSVHHPPSAHNNQSIRQQQQQHQQGQDSNGRLNIIPEMSIASNQTPFKIQRVMVENVLVPCLNKKPYEYNELLLSMLDLRDSFFPGISLDNCRRVLDVLGIELYMGNKRQIQVLHDSGKPHAQSMPLVQVRDVLQYMPQLRYMVRGSDTGPANKRPRMS